MDRIYTYFLAERPASIGTQPKEGLIDIYTWDKKTYIPEAGRSVWSELHYSRPLTEKEISDYEMVPFQKK